MEPPNEAQDRYYARGAYGRANWWKKGTEIRSLTGHQQELDSVEVLDVSVEKLTNLTVCGHETYAGSETLPIHKAVIHCRPQIPTE